MANGDEPPVQQGYEWLENRVSAALETVLGLEVAATSEIAEDDAYLHPIYRTFHQDVVQCLLSALDHLRFLSWSLRNRNEPFPYAQFTLIRTAITGGSTALWMLSGSTRDERRIRALEFSFKDIRSEVAWVDTVRAFPQNQDLNGEDHQEWADEMGRRQDWIVEQANSLLNPTTPLTRRSFAKQCTTDTEIVTLAGRALPAGATGSYDPAITLLNTWQTMSGFAHARPWAALPGREITGTDPVTGWWKVTQKGDPNRLLDAAFRGLPAVEEAVRRLVALSRP
ncbi:hypothetical protein H7K33_07330 [Mycobacterium paraense]|uniref:hypothetical protein n=1 Tax=Mycobacterium paraense TaxID=767916 RepID=UPI000A166B21|nr:hypothetical protein [Mycobacterium paraense]MCV7442032.1 hypothetical protein [Mycobacterium paraense]ORW41040.1 hypothetical protein AWB89_21180 [Mycobacterium paraense]